MVVLPLPNNHPLPPPSLGGGESETERMNMKDIEIADSSMERFLTGEMPESEARAFR